MPTSSKTRILSMILSLALVLGVVGIFPVSAAGPDALIHHDLGVSGALTIGASDSNDYRITGRYNGDATAIRIEGPYTGTITLADVDIRASGSASYALHILKLDGSDITIQLEGNNALQGGEVGGIWVSNDTSSSIESTVTITGDKLTVTGGRFGITASTNIHLILDAQEITFNTGNTNSPNMVRAGLEVRHKFTLQSGNVTATSAYGCGFAWLDGATNIIQGGTMIARGPEGNYGSYPTANSRAFTAYTDSTGTTRAYKVTVGADTGGTAGFADHNYDFDFLGVGEQIELIASPAGNYKFDRWYGSAFFADPQSPATQLTMGEPSSMMVTASFLPIVLVTDITVDGASGQDSITTKGGTLQMSADVQPANATNKNVTWTVSGTGATVNSNGFLTATANGTVTVRATATDGSGKYGEKVITISGQDTTGPAVPVTSISVNSGADSITSQGGTLQMMANVLPDNATNKNVTWTVSGSAATISNTGMLTATANGTVTVRATATDGSGVYGEKVITISGQSSGGDGGSSSSGSRGSSGSSSGGSSKPDSTTTTGWAAAPATEWVNPSNAGGTPSRSSGKTGIKAGDWQKLPGGTFTHDTMDGNSVQVRIVVSNPSQWKQETMLSGYVKGQSVDSIRTFFEKWFRNSIRVIHFDQQADWEQQVSVAAKVDLTGLDTDNLVFYSYTRSNNTYRQIAAPNYYIDANGYLRFVTPYAGSIVISDGTLEKK